MNDLAAAPHQRLSSSIVLAISGIVAMALYFLALLLPGQNIHGGTLTLFTLLFGLSVPPLCFAVGLVLGFMNRHRYGSLGLWVNVAALALYVFWVMGGLDKVLG